MYEFSLLLSVFLVIVSLWSMIRALRESKASAGRAGLLSRFLKPETASEDDRVLPLEQAVQQALAKRRMAMECPN